MSKAKVLSLAALFTALGLAVLTPGIRGFMTDSTEAAKFIREVEGIKEYELQNSLRVLLLEDHSSPVSTLMLTYLVGSRHESDKFRGGAHLLEHLMFKGTPTYNKQNGNSIAKELQKTGALLNASTWKDGTNYYESLPSEKLDLALDIEADRMRNSYIRHEDFVSEMPVVQSEFDRLENSPLVALDLATWKEAFKEHNYQHPVIGIREDLEKMPIETLKDFYNTYYWPNNAVLAIIGDFNTEALLKKIVDKFGHLPRAPHEIPQPQKVEPQQNETRFVNVTREDQLEAVLIAHKAPAATHPDSAVLDVLGYILSRGKTARLYRNLVDQGAAVEVYSEFSKSHDPGLFFSEVILTPYANHDLIRDSILKTYASIKSAGVTNAELERAKNKLRAQVAYSRDGSYSLSHQLSMAIAAGDWTLFSSYLDKLNAVTAEDVQRVAQTYLVDEKMTQSYLISKDPTLKAEKKDNLELKDLNRVEHKVKEIKEAVTPPFKRSEIPAGPLATRIQTEETQTTKIFSAQTGVRDVVTLMGSFEGAGHAYTEIPILAELVVSMLDEGTQEHTKFEIAQALEDRGAKISFQIDHNRVGFHARCLTKDIPVIIRLIAEQLRFPRFAEDHFLRVKEQQKVMIRQAMNDTSTQAHTALTQMIYPENHVNYEDSFSAQLESLERITLEDVREFHKKHYGPNKMILTAAGDINHESLVAAVKKHFDDWPKVEIAKNFETQIKANTKGDRRVVFLADKVKVDATFGHALPVTRDQKDYIPLYVANAVLGGDFSARLSSTVRDEQGLTYSVHSELQGIDSDVQGHWQINIILNKNVLQKGIDATLEQVRKFVQDGISPDELENKIETITGKYKVSLSTSGGFAHRILRNAEFGFDLAYLDQYPLLIQAATVNETNSLIKKYFDPAKLHLVISGTVDEKHQSPTV